MDSKYAVLASLIAMVLGTQPARAAESGRDAWPVVVSQSSGMLMETRLNGAIQAVDTNFPYEAVFIVKADKISPGGFPYGEASFDFRKIADQLEDLIEKKKVGKFVAIETRDGSCQFLFYVSSEETAKSAGKTMSSTQSYSAKVEVKNDPSWSSWRATKALIDNKRFGYGYGSGASSPSRKGDIDGSVGDFLPVRRKPLF